jgi:hypothetical protein
MEWSVAGGPELSADSGPVHSEKSGRQRNLRKKSAPVCRDSLEDDDDEDLASVREAIAAARLNRDARRAAGVTSGMPRGGGRKGLAPRRFCAVASSGRCTGKLPQG